MKYPIEAFDALVQEVESQGGALLPETCEPRDVTYVAPPYNSASNHKGITCGCHNPTMLLTVYDPQLEKRQGGSGFVTACAVCDNIGAWPRYCDAVYAVEPELNPAFYDDEDEDEDAD